MLGRLEVLARRGAQHSEPKKMPRNLSLLTSAVGAAAISLSLLTVSPVNAATVTFVTPTGSMTSGAVDASAAFTTTAGQISLTLSNLQANIKDVAQAISDISFTLTGGLSASGATLGTNTGQEITVNSNGSFTLGPTVSTGWALSTSGSTVTLDVLGTAVGPAHLIIGPSGPGNTFSNANGSIAGNGPHNPFLNQSATFLINLGGVTTDTTISSAIFSFGTTEGENLVPGVVS